MAIDKTIWHYEVPDYPKELANEQGGVHIAFFLRWMLEEGFAGPELLEAYPSLQMKIKLKVEDALEILNVFLDGVLVEADFNAAGARFANAYYLEKETYSRQYGNYLEDYEKIMLDLKHLPGYETFYQGVEYSDENYEKVRHQLDTRFSEYKEWLEKQEI